ncbi:hypothetical protein H696_05128 [Fonticula alba]|uniref:Uncharacterized protein n=1 Tax=Fonticula alba TaxID=691883 RepID=A0A058Z1N8_FONAL|nr:hypothetical protein H696_05128 [Fonticula alba]KCV68199.1 hypothetical protein H696_05128 [Fonticula alba]|eukprot:XP_009497253.1 hypothetical protein H696_05128 [Fonticula alba]
MSSILPIHNNESASATTTSSSKSPLRTIASALMLLVFVGVVGFVGFANFGTASAAPVAASLSTASARSVSSNRPTAPVCDKLGLYDCRCPDGYMPSRDTATCQKIVCPEYFDATSGIYVNRVGEAAFDNLPESSPSVQVQGFRISGPAPGPITATCSRDGRWVF